MALRLGSIMKFSSIILFLIAILFSQSGYEIAEKMSQKDVPTDIKSSFIMVLEDKRGNTFESEIVSHSKDDGKKQILWFLSPSSNRGVSLYKIENENGKDEMKMYLPAFKKIRKISSRKKSESFMNSDLTFEDLYNRDLDDFTYDIDLSDDSFYILSSYPIEGLGSTYSKHISWIDKKSLLIIKEESYGKSGVLLKTKEIKYVNQDEFDLVKEIHVLDVKTKHKTHLIFKKMELNTGLEDAQFHEMHLKRLP